MEFSWIQQYQFHRTISARPWPLFQCYQMPSETYSIIFKPTSSGISAISACVKGLHPLNIANEPRKFSTWLHPPGNWPRVISSATVAVGSLRGKFRRTDEREIKNTSLQTAFPSLVQEARGVDLAQPSNVCQSPESCKIINKSVLLEKHNKSTSSKLISTAYIQYPQSPRLAAGRR